MGKGRFGRSGQSRLDFREPLAAPDRSILSHPAWWKDGPAAIVERPEHSVLVVPHADRGIRARRSGSASVKISRLRNAIGLSTSSSALRPSRLVVK